MIIRSLESTARLPDHQLSLWWPKLELCWWSSWSSLLLLLLSGSPLPQKRIWFSSHAHLLSCCSSSAFGGREPVLLTCSSFWSKTACDVRSFQFPSDEISSIQKRRDQCLLTAATQADASLPSRSLPILSLHPASSYFKHMQSDLLTYWLTNFSSIIWATGERSNMMVWKMTLKKLLCESASAHNNNLLMIPWFGKTKIAANFPRVIHTACQLERNWHSHYHLQHYQIQPPVCGL